MTKISYTIFSLFVMLSVFAANAGNTLVSAKMDSTVLLMGKKTAIHVEIVQDEGVTGRFTNEDDKMLTDFVEVSERTEADTVNLGNDRIQINRDIIVQSFDSGMYVIPAFKYVVGKDTFKSSELTLKVIPVKVDSMTNVHDFKPVAAPPFFLTDYIPEFILKYWWLILLVLLVIAGGVYAYIKWFKTGELPVLKKVKVIPPYDEAMMKLTELKGEHLWEAGQDKEYFTRLTDILRNYIERRFDVNAKEMTTSQLIDALRKNEETMPVNEQLNKILEMADFVKFAKMRPLPEDNEVAYQRALNFVNETKPVEVVPEENAENNDKKGEEVVEK